MAGDQYLVSLNDSDSDELLKFEEAFIVTTSFREKKIVPDIFIVFVDMENAQVQMKLLLEDAMCPQSGSYFINLFINYFSDHSYREFDKVSYKTFFCVSTLVLRRQRGLLPIQVKCSLFY